MNPQNELDFMKIDLPALLRELAGAGALDYRHYPDGSMVVVNSVGQKLTFTPEEVRRALKRIQPRPKPQGGKPS